MLIYSTIEMRSANVLVETIGSIEKSTSHCFKIKDQKNELKKSKRIKSILRNLLIYHFRLVKLDLKRSHKLLSKLIFFSAAAVMVFNELLLQFNNFSMI